MTACYRRWHKVDIPSDNISPRTGHTVVEFNGHSYLFGGTDKNSRQQDMYRFINNGWESIPATGDIPPRRSGAQSACHGGMMYLFGGYDGKDKNYFNDLFAFNFTTREWKEIVPNRVDENSPPLRPPARTDHCFVAHGDSLYVFGGYDGQLRFQDTHCFNTNTCVWTCVETKGEKPTKRFGHSGVVYQNQILIFGGWDGKDTLNCVWSLNFENKTWTKVEEPVNDENSGNLSNRLSNIVFGRQSLFVPQSRYRHSAVVYQNIMFVFGGVDKDHRRFGDILVFNLDTCVWAVHQFGGYAPSARTFHQSVVIGDNVLVVGGYDGKQRLNDMFSLYLGPLSPAPLQEMAASVIRRNKELTTSLPPLIVETLVWTRDASNVLRGGRKDLQGCTACEVYQCSFETGICGACGHNYIQHELIRDDPFCESWQPEAEFADSRQDAACSFSDCTEIDEAKKTDKRGSGFRAFFNLF